MQKAMTWIELLIQLILLHNNAPPKYQKKAFESESQCSANKIFSKYWHFFWKIRAREFIFGAFAVYYWKS